jgi:hypothetical protein
MAQDSTLPSGEQSDAGCALRRLSLRVYYAFRGTAGDELFQPDKRLTQGLPQGFPRSR